jgi:hypothetical protein
MRKNCSPSGLIFNVPKIQKEVVAKPLLETQENFYEIYAQHDKLTESYILNLSKDVEFDKQKPGIFVIRFPSPIMTATASIASSSDWGFISCEKLNSDTAVKIVIRKPSINMFTSPETFDLSFSVIATKKQK